MLILAADHVIKDTKAFQAAVKELLPAVEAGKVTVGVRLGALFNIPDQLLQLLANIIIKNIRMECS